MLYSVQLQCPSSLMVEAEDPQDAANKYWDALTKAGALVFRPLAGTGDAGPMLQKMTEPKSNIAIVPTLPPQLNNGRAKS